MPAIGQGRRGVDRADRAAHDVVLSAVLEMRVGFRVPTSGRQGGVHLPHQDLGGSVAVTRCPPVAVNRTASPVPSGPAPSSVDGATGDEQMQERRFR